MARRFFVFSLLAALLSAPAPAATGCAADVLRDWSDDGRVGPTYAAPCYEQAIDSLPSDLRDYTNAEEEITRALQSAVRTGGVARVADVSEPTDTTSKPPIVLIGAAAVAGLVLATGGAAYAARRRRRSEP